MTKVGILSDTHLNGVTDEFARMAKRAFAECQVIIHAGDLTDISVLSVFREKQIHAVCGNCCNFQTAGILPEKKIILLDRYRFGLCHGAGNRLNIEERMYSLFAECDCIIYGHTHNPVIKKYGSTLLINPGSFATTGKYGSPGSYAILDVDDTGIHPKLLSTEELF